MPPPANKSKKRKRQEKLQQYGVDLPEIPGVPVEVIPVLVHALKVATNFFKYQTSKPHNDDWEKPQDDNGTVAKDTTWSINNHASNQNSVSDPLDNVLNRVERVAEDPESVTKQQQQQQRQLKMKDATQSWLQAVKRFVKKRYHREPAITNTNGANQVNSGAAVTANSSTQHNHSDQNQRSVPFCCFLYLFQLGQEHKRLAVRRAALYMNRLLLDKAADCRRYFLEDQLWSWLQLLRFGDPEFDATKQRLWQQEGLYLLLHLRDQNYGDLYPKLAVSEQYLRQACSLELTNTASAATTTTTLKPDGEFQEGEATTNMTSLRKLRDIAMEYGEEELTRGKKLVHRCHQCMDILVPRMDGTDPQSRQTEASGIFMDGDDNNGDEDDIDWEDGWENQIDDSVHEDFSEEAHVGAVERTLQAMEAMGGFKNGVLEIELNAPNDTHMTAVAASATSAPKMAAARARFAKCAGFVADRHLPRIQAWLLGLARADRLVVNENKSMVLMTFAQGQQRGRIQEDLKELSLQMKSVVESAARLGLVRISGAEQNRMQRSKNEVG